MLHRPHFYTVNLSPSLPQRDPQPFTRVTLHGRKGNHQMFQGFTDAGSELTQFRGPRPISGPPASLAGACGSQTANGVLRARPSHKGSDGSPRRPCGWFPSSAVGNWTRQTQHLATPYGTRPTGLLAWEHGTKPSPAQLSLWGGLFYLQFTIRKGPSPVRETSLGENREYP